MAATWVLKIDGPYYADGIAAGIYVVGFLIAVWSFRTVRRAEAQLDEPLISIAPVFVALAVFFLAAAGAVVWFTYIAPPEPGYADDGVAVIRLGLRRQFA